MERLGRLIIRTLKGGELGHFQFLRAAFPFACMVPHAPHFNRRFYP